MLLVGTFTDGITYEILLPCYSLPDMACEGDHQPACYHMGYLLLYGGDGFKQVHMIPVERIYASIG